MLAAAEEVVLKRGQGPSRADVARCLAGVLGTTRLALLLDHERPLDDRERAAFRAQLARLLDGEPLAYVLGHAEFFGREFRVGPEVLIPRPETELLVTLALEALAQGASVFEPCTGSGCIGVTLACERPDLRVLASDVSAAALAVARENAARHGATLEIVAGSFFEPAAGRVFDALVANPPYVDPDKPELVAESVRRFEPAAAVFGPRGRPLAAHAELLKGGVEGLRPGALVLLEVGADTAAAALSMIERSRSYERGELIADLAGHQRVLRCRRR